jgi:pimeloyl-ACP methyl ester carboxylesterase
MGLEESFQKINQLSLIGNLKSKELHTHDCHWAKKIKKENRIEFHRYNQAKRLGFDTCGYCLDKYIGFLQQDETKIYVCDVKTKMIHLESCNRCVEIKKGFECFVALSDAIVSGYNNYCSECAPSLYKESSIYVGDRKTRKIHQEECSEIDNISSGNQIAFNSISHGLQNNFGQFCPICFSELHGFKGIFSKWFFTSYYHCGTTERPRFSILNHYQGFGKEFDKLREFIEINRIRKIFIVIGKAEFNKYEPDLLTGKYYNLYGDLVLQNRGLETNIASDIYNHFNLDYPQALVITIWDLNSLIIESSEKMETALHFIGKLIIEHIFNKLSESIRAKIALTICGQDQGALLSYLLVERLKQLNDDLNVFICCTINPIISTNNFQGNPLLRNRNKFAIYKNSPDFRLQYGNKIPSNSLYFPIIRASLKAINYNISTPELFKRKDNVSVAIDKALPPIDNGNHNCKEVLKNVLDYNQMDLSSDTSSIISRNKDWIVGVLTDNYKKPPANGAKLTCSLKIFYKEEPAPNIFHILRGESCRIFASVFKIDEGGHSIPYQHQKVRFSINKQSGQGLTDIGIYETNENGEIEFDYVISTNLPDLIQVNIQAHFIDHPDRLELNKEFEIPAVRSVFTIQDTMGNNLDQNTFISRFDTLVFQTDVHIEYVDGSIGSYGNKPINFFHNSDLIVTVISTEQGDVRNITFENEDSINSNSITFYCSTPSAPRRESSYFNFRYAPIKNSLELSNNDGKVFSQTLINRGDEIDIKSRLSETFPNGRIVPIENKLINLTLERSAGETIDLTSLTIDSNGYVFYNYTVPQLIMNNRITFSSSCIDLIRHNSTAIEVRFPELKNSIAFFKEGKKLKYPLLHIGDTITIKVQFYEANIEREDCPPEESEGVINPIANEEVTFLFENGTSITTSQMTTNSSGIAEISYRIPYEVPDQCIDLKIYFTAIGVEYHISEKIIVINEAYFSSHIFNTDEKRDDQSTFSVLSYDNLFMDLDEVVDYANTNSIDKLFFVFAGQQVDKDNAEEVADQFFCRDLTGGDRQHDEYKVKWNGGYKIHTSHEFPSVASILYDQFNESSLIIDVLHCKYWFYKGKKGKERTFNYLIQKFYNELIERLNNHNTVKIFICGYSRGGFLSLMFAQALLDKGITPDQIGAVVTLDPVINRIKDEKNDWVDHWCFIKKKREAYYKKNKKRKYYRRIYKWLNTKSRKNPHWIPRGGGVTWKAILEVSGSTAVGSTLGIIGGLIGFIIGMAVMVPIVLFSKEHLRFPVLKSNDSLMGKYYNAFQRRGWMPKKLGDEDKADLGYQKLGKPVGCAVNQAISPKKSGWPEQIETDVSMEDIKMYRRLIPWGLAKKTSTPPMEQFDMKISSHAPRFIDKYKNWVIFVAKKTMT